MAGPTGNTNIALTSHKVCSLHFHGGMKSFSALPTVVKISCRQTVNSSQGKIHVIKTTTETSQSEQQTTALTHKSQPLNMMSYHLNTNSLYCKSNK